MSEPMWCEVRRHYCCCQDYGRRCDEYEDAAPQEVSTRPSFGQVPGVGSPPAVAAPCMHDVFKLGGPCPLCLSD
jgi:hypothetical protein